MKYPLLFSPIALSGHVLRNRIAMSPTYVGYQTVEGLPSELTLKHYSDIARGGVGLLIVEASAVAEDQAKLGRILRAYAPEHIAPLSKLAQAIHEGGATSVLQLNHLGRLNFMKPVGPSAVPFFKSQVREMTADEVTEAIRQFAEAAAIVKEAGFDMVELHGGTGYLLAQFFSSRTNQRTDMYGGSLEKRMTFALKTIEEIKKKTGWTSRSAIA